MKLLLSITVIALLFSNCLFQPKNCTVTIISYDLNINYSFECNYNNAMDHISKLELNKPDVNVSNLYNLGKCDFSFHYNDNESCVDIFLVQVGNRPIKRRWGKNNPNKLLCLKVRWNKVKKKLNNKLTYKNVDVRFLVEKM